MMRKNILTAIMKHAQDAYPQEACGLIIMIGRAQRYIRCSNTAENPNDNFRIAPEEYAAAEDQGEIVFIVHSHPDATSRPTPLDEAQCEESGLPWVIISWPEGDVRTIVPKGVVPLLDRPFVHGHWDCYSLVRDWYAQERCITLPNFERTDEWWRRGENLYLKNYAAAGFYPHQSPLEPGDVILMQYQAPEVNHAGIYIGNGQMLHHLYGQTSRVVPYGGIWQDRTILTLRYSDDHSTPGS
jgi:proteasome lid subunit RPN8/RPN11